jgi:hypothetical protein
MERSANVPYQSVPQHEHGSVTAINNNGDYPFTAPTPQFAGQTMESRGSQYGSMDPLRNETSAHHSTDEMGARGMNEKGALYEAPNAKSKRKGLFWALVALALVIVLVAIIVPVYLFVIKKKDGDDGNTSTGTHHGTGNNSTNNEDTNHEQTPGVVTWGGDGSIVTKEDGTTFVYNNTFGGFWVYDPANPLNNSARAQEHTPPLTENWKWGVDAMYGYVYVFCFLGDGCFC